MAEANRTDYKRSFNEKNYDRLAVTVPKGRKLDIEACAKARGESVNGLVNSLLRSVAGMTEEEWKKGSDA